ncbi:MAG: MFS transporter [Blastocatellia bacterium]|nr:MFS transporter [Blastocatellia bacterium]
MLSFLTLDGKLLFVTRMVRLFAYGALSVVLTLYLSSLGFSDWQIGLLLSLTLVGDTGISLWITLAADRLGRRRMLVLGSGLMVLAGMVFAFTGNFLLLLAAAMVGTISPSGGEVGPFLSIEQAILSQTITDEHRTRLLAWYNLVGSMATAAGALAGGSLTGWLQNAGSSPLQSYRVVLIGYGMLGIVLGCSFAGLSAAAEVTQPIQSAATTRFGLHRSRPVVARLAMLFMVDSFAGGLLVQSLLAYWFTVRFGAGPGTLGGIFFAGNLLAGLSALLAARLARHFGLVNTMVFTHIPSNLLLLLVPLMPSLGWAVLVLLLRFTISQMDVPTRQSYIMAVVAPDERTAAAGITSIVRTASSSLAPFVTGWLLTNSWWSTPFFLAGGLKIIYDIALYRSFRNLKPPEEQATEA